MYKELSFRSVSKPGRITAPGFVFGVMAAALATVLGPDGSWGMAIAPHVFLELNLRLKKSL
jgi:hypothetical protein